MAHMLLVNPRRRKARKTTRRANPARKTARRRVRRANPLFAAAPRHVRRRRNPLFAHKRRHHVRRRRNPISFGGSKGGIAQMLKDAALGGVGAVAMDIVMGYANGVLPTSLQTTPNTVGIGDAVKAALTIGLGEMLRSATKGASIKVATGALTVQVSDIVRSFVPSTMTLGANTPAVRVIRGNPRVGPNAGYLQNPGMGRYIGSQNSQLLNRYTAGSPGQLLNGTSSQMRFR